MTRSCASPKNLARLRVGRVAGIEEARVGDDRGRAGLRAPRTAPRRRAGALMHSPLAGSRRVPRDNALRSSWPRSRHGRGRRGTRAESIRVEIGEVPLGQRSDIPPVGLSRGHRVGVGCDELSDGTAHRSLSILQKRHAARPTMPGDIAQGRQRNIMRDFRPSRTAAFSLSIIARCPPRSC